MFVFKFLMDDCFDYLKIGVQLEEGYVGIIHELVTQLNLLGFLPISYLKFILHMLFEFFKIFFLYKYIYTCSIS